MKDKKAHERIDQIESDVSQLKMTTNVMHHNDIEGLKHENIELKNQIETLELRMIAIGKQLAKLSKKE